MVRSMLSYSTPPIGLWMEALKTVIHMLNRIPSKSMFKTLYELLTECKLSLNYLRVWDCPAETKIFNPNADKLESKTVSCHFIGYSEKSKGFRFYYLYRHNKFVEMRHAIFLEDEMMRGSTVGVNTLGTTGHRLRTKVLDTIGSLQWQMAGEPYTPYQEMTSPLQAKGEGSAT
jgi:hypothetical protein